MEWLTLLKDIKTYGCGCITQSVPKTVTSCTDCFFAEDAIVIGQNSVPPCGAYGIVDLSAVNNRYDWGSLSFSVHNWNELGIQGAWMIDSTHLAFQTSDAGKPNEPYRIYYLAKQLATGDESYGYIEVYPEDLCKDKNCTDCNKCDGVCSDATDLTAEVTNTASGIDVGV